MLQRCNDKGVVLSNLVQRIAQQKSVNMLVIMEPQQIPIMKHRFVPSPQIAH